MSLPHTLQHLFTRDTQTAISPAPQPAPPLIPPIFFSDSCVYRVKLRTPHPAHQQTSWAGLSKHKQNLPLPTTSPFVPPLASHLIMAIFSNTSFPLLLYFPHPANHHGNIICSLYSSQSETFKNRSQILSLPSSYISRSVTSFLE